MAAGIIFRLFFFFNLDFSFIFLFFRVIKILGEVVLILSMISFDSSVRFPVTKKIDNH